MRNNDRIVIFGWTLCWICLSVYQIIIIWSFKSLVKLILSLIVVVAYRLAEFCSYRYKASDQRQRVQISCLICDARTVSILINPHSGVCVTFTQSCGGWSDWFAHPLLHAGICPANISFIFCRWRSATRSILLRSVPRRCSPFEVCTSSLSILPVHLQTEWPWSSELI